ncbi:MAG: hypothetical protein ACYTFW_04540 [Planctomycetota bacterium]|jgi:hypothetical protein
MNIWERLFGKLGLWVIPLMILAWVAQQAFQHRLEEDQIKLTTLTEKRAGEIQNLYSNLTEAEKLMNDLYYLYKPIGIDPPQIDPVEAVRRIRELNDLAAKQRIFYPKDIQSLIDSMCSGLLKVAHRLEEREMLLRKGERGSEREAELEQQAWEELKIKIPQIRKELESGFRHLLGANR